MDDESKNSIPTISEVRTENNARLNLLYGIGSILASSETIAAAAPQILEAVCRALQYEAGEFWSFEREGESLRFKTAWHSSPEAEIFFEESRKFEFVKVLRLFLPDNFRREARQTSADIRIVNCAVENLNLLTQS